MVVVAANVLGPCSAPCLATTLLARASSACLRFAVRDGICSYMMYCMMDHTQQCCLCLRICGCRKKRPCRSRYMLSQAVCCPHSQSLRNCVLYTRCSRRRIAEFLVLERLETFGILLYVHGVRVVEQFSDSTESTRGLNAVYSRILSP